MIDDALLLKLRAYIKEHYQDLGAAVLAIIGKALEETHWPSYARGFIADDIYRQV